MLLGVVEANVTGLAFAFLLYLPGYPMAKNGSAGLVVAKGLSALNEM
jgi:hypothetical protein